MKLVTYQTADGRIAPGVLTADMGAIVDLGGVFPDMIALIAAGDNGLATARSLLAAGAKTTPLAQARLLAPVQNPPRLRDCSVFEAHIKGGAAFVKKFGGPDALATVPEIWYREPIFYKGNHLAIAGPDQEIAFPKGWSKLDYELEVAAVIGKSGKNIAPESALDHLFGFTIFNDLTARDVSMEILGLMGPAKAKDWDSANVFGPWLVTRDAIPDIYNMKMTATLNGVPMGEGGNTRDMYHKWDAIIAHMSKNETLHIGEIIGSGTCPGGTLIEFGKFLHPGDAIEFAIDGLGVLRNTVS